MLKLILGALGTSMTQRVSEQAKEKMDHLAFAIAENREQIGGIFQNSPKLLLRTLTKVDSYVSKYCYFQAIHI